jgi:uncharacterized protein (DUF488 family)
LAQTRLFSIGHSNHELARLIALFRNAGVTAVADVRSQPFSQRCPQFNRPDLARELAQQEIAYAYLGEQLGGRPANQSLYDIDGRVDYERVRKLPAFQQGLDRLCQGLESFAVAMLCSEEDPLVCHRGLMIAPALVERGLRPVHIRGSGVHETSSEFEDRLLAETKVGVGIFDGLFAGTITESERERLLAEAYRIQARRKGFRLRLDSQGEDSELEGE